MAATGALGGLGVWLEGAGRWLLGAALFALIAAIVLGRPGRATTDVLSARQERAVPGRLEHER